jgi:proteic killer suppression protein
MANSYWQANMLQCRKPPGRRAVKGVLKYSVKRNTLCGMIRSWADPKLKRFFLDGRAPAKAGWASVDRIALRKLDMLDAAARLEDLRSPPGNRLEALKGDRSGQHSIRINNQWRICFTWRNGDAEEVEIVDYH